MAYHREFSYFIKDFNINYAGEIEQIPGVPPSAGRVARVALKAKREKVNLVLASTHSKKNILNKFKEFSGINFIQVPISIHKNKKTKNLW